MPHFCGRNHTVRPRRVWTEERVIVRPHEEIARMAYSYWEARGRQHGHAEEDWLRAERELRKPRG